MAVKIIFSSYHDFSSSDYDATYEKLPDDFKQYVSKKKNYFVSLTPYVILANYGFNIANLVFSPNGKPLLRNLHFSISNKCEYSVVAISDRNIGIDMEIIKSTSFDILKYFHPDEQKYIGHDVERLYQIWTAKEAYLKLNDLTFKEVAALNMLTLKDEFCFVYQRKQDFMICYCQRKEG